MARNREVLGLNQYELAEIPDTPESGVEKPDFKEVGGDRLARAKERITSTRKTITSGFMSVVKRVAAAPEMAKYYKDKGIEKIGDIHEGLGNMKESVIDKIGEKVVIPLGERTIEPAKAGVRATKEATVNSYHTVVETGRAAYSNLDMRARNGWKAFEGKVTAFKEAMERRKKEAEFRDAQARLDAAMERYNMAAKAMERNDLVYSKAA